MHVRDRFAGLAGWPPAGWLEGFDHRVGFYLVSLAALIGLKWRGGWDLQAFQLGADDLARTGSAYTTTLSVGADQWGVTQVYVSPPFVAHLLVWLRWVPGDVLFALWGVAGLIVLGAAIRALPGDALARRAPRLVFGLGYVWATVFLGQVNLFVLAGLLLALGSRSNWLSGAGLATAVLLRGTPAIFAIELVLQRRWRALGWSAAFGGLGVLLSGPSDWVTFVDVSRQISALPTLDVPVQMSLLQFGWPLAVAVGVALVSVLVLARWIPREAPLLRGTALGMALVLVPANTWIHWLAFASAPLLLAADEALWSRRALLALLFTGLIVVAWPSMLVCLAIVAAMTWRVWRVWRDWRVRGAAAEEPQKL